MFIDQLIKDALSFIKRLVTWRSKHKEAEQKPFKSMRTHSGEWGIISLVIGRDTPRALRTWIYSPKRWNQSEAQKTVNDMPQDLHFYLDFLGPMPNANTRLAQEERLARKEERRSGKNVLTHRIQILKASHFLNKDGIYDCELIFWGDFDFHRAGSFDPNKEATMVIDKLVSACLRLTDPFSLAEEDWKLRVEQMWYHVQGGRLEPDPLAQPQPAKVRAGYAQGKAVRRRPGTI
jgi:hypothetical protein